MTRKAVQKNATSFPFAMKTISDDHFRYFDNEQVNSDIKTLFNLVGSDWVGANGRCPASQ